MNCIQAPAGNSLIYLKFYINGNILALMYVYLRGLRIGMFKLIFLVIFSSPFCLVAQNLPKSLAAKKTIANIKIDGFIDEAAWKEATPATGFIEQRPDPGQVEDTANKTRVYLLYDNTSVYIAGFCHERTKDSISKELTGRDRVGINDYVGVVLDTYNDKSNALGFFVTPYGEQFDIKYSSNNEDISWSAVWDSESKILADGWSFEMRIPYSALRFVSKENQTWGLNFVRRRTKSGKQFTWNPINPKVNGFINQEGELVNIGKIESPLRLSFSPYLAGSANYYKPDTKDWRTSVSGGMDVKYGISESFTLDITLVPDFGQVRSDNKVLNLSPFEVQYSENRPFFTEGTELFSKGNLFYSRRVGSIPIHYGDIYSQLSPGETVISNPQEAKLVNATKISGRTTKGLGVGFFNAVTKPMYAEIENASKESREIKTNPLTNYNIIILDQNLKNNSSVSFINTNVLRSGIDYDANVSAALFNINNKKNTYNWNGKVALSHLTNPFSKGITGYSHYFSFRKTGGQWNYNLSQKITDDKYDINDLGIQNFNNNIEHNLYTGYRWIKPHGWYNRMQINYNGNYSSLYKKFAGQQLDTKYQSFNTNINGNAQLKSLWNVGFSIGYRAAGNDFYEPHQQGMSFRTPKRVQFSGWFESNSAKKYFAELNFFMGLRSLFNGRNQEINYSHRYRFNDKFSISQSILINPFTNDAGYYTKYFENINNVQVFRDVVFSRRNRKTIENVLEAKYNFNNRSGITFRARHYASKVTQKQLYDLKSNGTLSPTIHTGIALRDQNFNIFNIDAVYTLQFAPGSFINIVWKEEGQLFNREVDNPYFKNFSNTLSQPQNNNFSFKIIYFLDYLDLKKWRGKKVA